MNNNKYKVLKHSRVETVASVVVTMNLDLKSANIMSGQLNDDSMFTDVYYDYYRMSMSEQIRANRKKDDDDVERVLNAMLTA